MNPFGFNILAQFVDNRTALIDWVTQARPAACVVMDDSKLAQAVRSASADSIVIYRDTSKNENSYSNIHDPNATTPEQWLSNHVQYADNDVVLQCFNEPGSPQGDDLSEFLNWLLKLISISPDTIRLALPAFAVGNPADSQILNGDYDALLRALAGSRHYLLLHEYFKQDPSSALESGALCGHFKLWLDRANGLGIQAPKIVIGEHGRDFGGGNDDGWKGQGWSEDDYFNRLVAAQSLYMQHQIPVCIYCYGYGGNHDWESFNIEHAETLKTQLIQYGKDHPLEAAPAVVSSVPDTAPGAQSVTAIDRTTLGDPIDGIIADVTLSFTNVRDTYSTQGNILGRLSKGDSITYRPIPTDRIGKYRWYALEKPWSGWFADVATPSPNP